MNRDTLIQNVKNGSIKFPVTFTMYDETIKIQNAVYDTGCAHSLISVDSLNLQMDRDKFQLDLLYDKSIKLNVSRGVEAQSINTQDIELLVNKINAIKESNLTVEEAIDSNKITDNEINDILISKNVRYEVTVRNYTIANLNLGDIQVRLAFNLGKTNLIGMHIIKELCTYVFNYKNNNILIAVQKSGDLYKDTQYITKLIKKLTNKSKIKKVKNNSINNNASSKDNNEISGTVLNAFSVKEKIEESKKTNQNKQV